MLYLFSGQIKSFPAKVERPEDDLPHLVIEVRYTIVQPSPKEVADISLLALQTELPAVFVTRQEQMVFENQEPFTLPEWILAQAAVHLRRIGYIVERPEPPAEIDIDPISWDDTREGAWPQETGDEWEYAKSSYNFPPKSDVKKTARKKAEEFIQREKIPI